MKLLFQSAIFGIRVLALVGVGAVASLANIAPAKAQFVEKFIYNHNGSKMLVVRDRRRVTITYQVPRSGLRRHGVRSGTMLFRGRLDSTGYLEGDAHIFKAGCGATPYYVYGQYTEGRSFRLTGAAPVLQGCRIVNNRHDIANANLAFNFMGKQAKRPPVQYGGNSGNAYGDNRLPANPHVYCLQRVRTGLNLRYGAGQHHSIMVEIPVGSCDVVQAKGRRGDWQQVKWRGRTGWVSRKYLRRVR